MDSTTVKIDFFPYCAGSVIFGGMKKHVLTILIVALLVVSCSPTRNTGIFHINSDGSIVLKNHGTAEGDITVPSTVGGETVKALGTAAFEDCFKLRSVTLPDSVTVIGARAFYDCRSLTSVNLGKNVTGIGREAFSDCRLLSSVTIPDGVKTIEANTFHGCEALTEVKLPENLETVGTSAFEGCSALESLTIPGSVTKIEETVFKYCTSLKTLVFNSETTDWEKIDKAENWKSGSSITVVKCTDGDITITTES